MTTYRAAYLAYPQSTGVVLTAQDERRLSDDELLTIARAEMAKVGIPAEDAQYLTIGDWMDGEIDDETAITTLDDLYARLTACPACLAGADPTDEDAPAHTCGDLDWTALPTFGGQEPRDTSGIWSWDATRLLVGECADDLRIEYRPLRVYTEGDQDDVVAHAESPRSVAAAYAQGQDWRGTEEDDVDGDPDADRYEIVVHLVGDVSSRWEFAAERAPNGFGRLVGDR